MAAQLTEREFTEKAIVSLRKGDFKGIHNVFSGFNAAARDYFSLDKDGCIAMINRLVEEGVIETRQGKKGYTLYLKGEKSEGGNTVEDVLAKMGL